MRTILVCVAAMLSAWAWAGQVAQTIQGHGNVRTWTVNYNSTRVDVRFKSGKERHIDLPQYEFDNGDFFLVSLLAVGNDELLVTHEKGAFLMDSSGRVLHEIGKALPKQIQVTESGPRTVADLPGPFEEGPGNRLVARGWNGRTILATYAETQYPYAVILDRQLRRLVAFLFEGGSIQWVKPDGEAGWRIGVRRGGRTSVFRISNRGQIRSQKAAITF